jgi:hypothetical protein
MANFRRKKMDGQMWSSPLARAAFHAALSVSLLLFVAAEIFCFIVFKINILEHYLSIIIFIIGGASIALYFQHLYIAKKRYDYILSDEYKQFNLSTTIGVTLCFLLFILSFLSCVIMAIIIDQLLTYRSL